MLSEYEKYSNAIYLSINFLRVWRGGIFSIAVIQHGNHLSQLLPDEMCFNNYLIATCSGRGILDTNIYHLKCTLTMEIFNTVPHFICQPGDTSERNRSPC